MKIAAYINSVKMESERVFIRLRNTRRNCYMLPPSDNRVKHSSFCLFNSLVFILVLLVSCEYVPYETGEGTYSDLHAEYVDMTIRQGVVTSIVTDNGENLVVPSSFSYSEKKDTMVRRLLYYNKKDDGQPIQVVSQKTVSMILPLMWTGQENAPTDPLTLTAVWMSENKRYLNMQIGLKVGSSEADAGQTIILRCDSVSTYNKGAIWLTLCHDQGNMLEYYTKEVLLSVSTKMLPDTIYFDANTYSGKKTWKIVK